MSSPCVWFPSSWRKEQHRSTSRRQRWPRLGVGATEVMSAAPRTEKDNDDHQNAELTLAKDTIRQFLQTSPSTSSSKFYIQGWRWHTMALVRDLQQLQQRASQDTHSTSNNGNDHTQQLQEAADYVVNFNMAALHKIETQTFFPWLKDKLVVQNQKQDSRDSTNQHLHHSFHVLLKHINDERRTISQLGNDIIQSIKQQGIKSSSSLPTNTVDLIQNTLTRTQNLMNCQEEFLIPAITALIGPPAQKSLNSQVLRNLGLSNSRIHLVAMYDAIVDNPQESKLFQESIPYVARMMIPRWRRLLYEPKTITLYDFDDHANHAAKTS